MTDGRPRWRPSGLLRTASSGTARVSLLAVLITVGIISSLFLVAGANPVTGIWQYLILPLTTQTGLLEVLVTATPILLTGAAVAIAFRAGFWNIGAEGQLLAGAVAAAGLGTLVGGLSPWLAIPIVLAGGALAGAAWVFIPALMRVRLGIDEVVTTLLLNPVALLLVDALLHGPWRDPKTGFPESPRIVRRGHLPDPHRQVPPEPGLPHRARGHHGRVVRLDPHRCRPAHARRWHEPARSAFRGHGCRAHPAACRAHQRRHRGSRGSVRGGRHPAPVDLRYLVRPGLHGHRGGDAGRSDDAGRAPGRPVPG